MADDEPPVWGESSRPGARQSGWSGGQRLGVGDVQGGAHPARLERRYQGVRVDDAAPGDVDQQRSGSHRRQETGVDEVAGLLGQRGDHHDHVHLGQQPPSAETGCTPARGRRATRTTSHSNGASRASIAAPIWP